jgi:hypothetical protein
VSADRRRGPRRAGVLETVGLVVEGDTEFYALPQLYRQALIPNCPPLKVKNLQGVGSDKDPAAVAKLVAGKVIAHRMAGIRKVVVCIDREQRPSGAGEFAGAVSAALAAKLAAKGHRPEDVTVVVSDRAFEAWLLADARNLHAQRLLKKVPAFMCFEGQLGAAQKKGCVELSDLLGEPYVKTKHGPALFAKLNVQAARNHGPGLPGSKSFDNFLRSLGV